MRLQNHNTAQQTPTQTDLQEEKPSYIDINSSYLFYIKIYSLVLPTFKLWGMDQETDTVVEVFILLNRFATLLFEFASEEKE